MFNPKVSDFLEENKDKTMIGFAWSLYWRIMLVVYGAIFAIAFLIGILGEL